MSIKDRFACPCMANPVSVGFSDKIMCIYIHVSG
jgi:hypothetical protein